MLIFNQRLQNVEYSIRVCEYTLLQKEEIEELVNDPRAYSIKILRSESSTTPAVFWFHGQKNGGFIFIDIEKRIWILDPTTWFLSPIPESTLVTTIKSLDEA